MKATLRDIDWYGQQDLKIRESAERARVARRAIRAEFDPGHLYVLRFFRGLSFEETCEFAKRVVLDARRKEYLDRLAAAVGGDLSRSWRDAHLAAFGTDDVEAEA